MISHFKNSRTLKIKVKFLFNLKFIKVKVNVYKLLKRNIIIEKNKRIMEDLLRVNIIKLKNQEKTNKGITLIALVITIIVLLILAGISIATLTGENGVLNKANTAKEETTKQEAKEKVQVEVIGSFDNNGKLNLEEPNNNLKNNILGLTYEGNLITNDNKIEVLPAIVVVDRYNIKIHENGNVTVEGEDTGGEDTPIPPVINEIEPGEKVTGDKNKTYTKNGTAVIPVGFAIVPGLDDIEEGLVISDVANDIENKGNQFVWIPIIDETLYERNTSYLSKNISAKSINDTNYLPDGIENEEAAVRSAKGFYISRYEAGKEGTNTLVSKKGVTVWINISQENAKTIAKTMFASNTHVKSGLISGIQWDMTMGFVNGKMDGTNKTYDVTKSDSSRHISGIVTISGKNEADKVCNIYDLEGNAYEYVAEKNTYDTNNPFIGRGGCFNYNNSASYRYTKGGTTDSLGSFRLVLYVK